MGKRSLDLPRKLFGYQTASVDQLVADREAMLGVAEQRVRSAEARIAELEEELSRRREDLQSLTSSREPVQAPPPPEWSSPADGTVDEEPHQAAELDRWLPPAMQARTVEFTPPPEPSAEFDPMPIGGEDRDWMSPPEDRWETPTAESWTAQSEARSVPEPTEEAWSAPSAEPEPQPEPEPEPVPMEQPALDTPAQPIIPPQITPAYLSEELANVVRAAEESATKIIERAWESTRTQISQVDRLWREVQAEIIRFATWRQHVDPMISTVQGYIEEARARIEEVPPRIQEALSPAVEAMARVDEGIGEFATASELPALLGKFHEDVVNALDDGDLTASTSATAATSGTIESPSGDLRSGEGEEVEMARAIANELRIINESGQTIGTAETA